MCADLEESWIFIYYQRLTFSFKLTWVQLGQNCDWGRLQGEICMETKGTENPPDSLRDGHR